MNNRNVLVMLCHTWIEEVLMMVRLSAVFNFTYHEKLHENIFLFSVIHNTDENHDDIYTSEQINSWITQICLGLSYLHSKNIIHRNVKPSKLA